jgi:hypothetical protein
METVPNSVRKQVERAEELRKQQYDTQPKDTGAEPAPGDDNQHDNQPNNPGTPQEPAAQPEPAKADAYADLEEQHRKLEQAHRALQGKYNAEVPRLTQQLREANEKLADAQKQASAAESKASEAKEKLNEHLAKVREEYGDDLANAFESVAAATSQQQDTHQPAQQEGGSAQDRFWRSLLRQVPDFEAVNRSPEFVQWLQHPSEKTGLSYQQELNEAGNDLDVLAVVEIVRAFKGAQAKAKQPDANAPENQLAPDRRNPQQHAKAEPAYTAKDFAKLQQDIAMGKWRGREVEARALEQKIHAALTGQSQT